MYIKDNAKPDIRNNIISGSEGSSSTSYGIWQVATAGKPQHVQNNDFINIKGGGVY
ncbi:MAG: hypothetical protein J7K04_02655 [Spirochaetales bacterium]|nr:hypothetical protein [Spirochaetales bacterium]